MLTTEDRHGQTQTETGRQRQTQTDKIVTQPTRTLVALTYMACIAVVPLWCCCGAAVVPLWCCCGAAVVLPWC